MTKFFRWIGLVWLAVLVGCATSISPNPTQSPLPAASPFTSPPAQDDVLIVYRRSGGLAGLNETWTIYADGRVQYQGGPAAPSKQLTPDQLNVLIDAVRASDFFSLNGSYVPANSCCDRFLYEITVTLDGRTQTVRTLDAAPDEPAALSKLRGTLNSILQDS